MKTYKVICPLYNFQISNVLYGPHKLSPEEVTNLFEAREKELVEGIEVFEGVKVRRVSKEDLDIIKSSFFPLPPDTKVSPGMFVLEKYITTEDDRQYQLDTTMRNIVLAMRLLKKGYISGSCVFYIPTSEKVNTLPFTAIEWSWEEGRKLETWGLKYALNFDDIANLKTLVEKIQSIDFARRKSLHLACKRFQRAYEEVDFEDQLIDFMIAFEALFLKGEKDRSPHGKIISVACSCLLGKNEEESEEIEHFLAEAYSIRNSIVHGSECKKPTVEREYEMSEFVSKIEDYLRVSIKKLLD